MNSVVTSDDDNLYAPLIIVWLFVLMILDIVVYLNQGTVKKYYLMYARLYNFRF